MRENILYYFLLRMWKQNENIQMIIKRWKEWDFSLWKKKENIIINYKIYVGQETQITQQSTTSHSSSR